MTAPGGRRLWVIGAGGFGREVVSLVRRVGRKGGGYAIAGVIDDDPSPENIARLERLGVPLAGDLEKVLRRTERWSAVVAIGDAVVRERIVRSLAEGAAAAVDYPVLVDPDATVGQDVELGEGTVVAAGARLSACIRVGAHAHLDQNVTVGHDTMVGDFARLNPAACVSGDVTLGRGVLIGANATVLQGRSVGDHAVVGAGAVVTRDVAGSRTVIGVPARPVD